MAVFPETITLIGVNHKTASLELRERLACAGGYDGPLAALAKVETVKEYYLLSTCNRVEILYVCHQGVKPQKEILSALFSPAVSADELLPHLYQYEQQEAVAHLFQVAASLDSMVVGEAQILGQMKDAYRYAAERGSTGLILNRLLHKSFSVAKRVRTETRIGASAVSIIKRARQDSHIKALVLRLDTGGGSAFASELIRQEIVLTQKKGKPVVVSMGAVTASGGYWLAANANHLVAAPSTLTGSIGIFGAAPTLEKTLANMGIHSDGVTVGKGTLPPGFTRGMSPEDEASFQLSVENGYKRFLEIVAQGRGKKVSNVEAIAQGRVWDGATALQLGLVDSLGDLHDAVKVAARLAKVPAENAVFIRAPANTFFEQMVEQKLPWESQLVSKWLSFASFSAATLAVHDHLTSQYSFLFEQADPNGLYAHSFLPDPGEIAH